MPENVTEKKKVTVLCNLSIQTDREIKPNKPELFQWKKFETINIWN